MWTAARERGVRTRLTPHTKIKSRRAKDPSVTPDTIKLWEENTEKSVVEINHSRVFFNPHPRIMKIKTKINKWNQIKVKSFFTVKETINKMKRQPSKWEKIFANAATDKRLISKIYKQLMELNIRKTNNPIKKWAKYLSRHFSKEKYKWPRSTWKDAQHQ